jgi:hypothetical protein
MWGKMIKNITLTLFFALITYAIVSDLGKSQHDYRAPGIASLRD